MDKEFVALSLIFLTPLILCSVWYSQANMAAYGVPNFSSDVVLTHYPAKMDAYSPIFPLINSTIRGIVGWGLYPTYFILISITICFVFPYILLWEATKRPHFGLFYLYGTAIPICAFVAGTLPQALLVDLMILMVARPKWWWWILGIAAGVHTFGVPIILITKLWIWYDARTPE